MANTHHPLLQFFQVLENRFFMCTIQVNPTFHQRSKLFVILVKSHRQLSVLMRDGIHLKNSHKKAIFQSLEEPQRRCDGEKKCISLLGYKDN